ncbi:MAG: D-alanyl-D-alanine carboxypeptidase [Chloroflexi bacterium]|nr:D-alanyl-D-alanine carboxypeptidase [Chloroflexota bacterium]
MAEQRDRTFSRRAFVAGAVGGAAVLIGSGGITSAAAAGARDDWPLDPAWRTLSSARRRLPYLEPPARTRDVPLPKLSAARWAVLDEGSGLLLQGQGEDDRVAIASTTKIATTSVVLERWGEERLAEAVPVTIDGGAMAARGSTVMGLQPGEQLRLETILYGLMLPSGNDAAEQLALAVGEGSRERFVGWMNERAAWLGLQNTHYVNPHGLDNPQHYSSARDLALFARDGMRRWETFAALARTQSYAGEGFRFANLNRLLGRYPGADGVKIGFTRAAGRTMVASAERGGRRLYVTVLKSDDLPTDAAALLDWAWASYRWD